MIGKLYDLKVLQIQQKRIEKNQILSSIQALNEEIDEVSNDLIKTTVSRYGAISDFTVLQIHKNTMKLTITTLEKQKMALEEKLKILLADMVELEKEKEQFNYVLNEEKKLRFKQWIKFQEEQSEEFIQNSYRS